MAIRRLSTARPGVKSNQFWDQDTAQGAMEPIAYWESPGTASTIAFSNIPQTYQDLYVVVYGRSLLNVQTSYSFYFNGTGFVGWSQTELNGNGSSATSRRLTTSTPCYGLQLDTAWGSTTAGVFSSSVFHVFNYKSSFAKTVLAKHAFDQNGSGFVNLVAGIWNNANPVQSIEVGTNGNWAGGTVVGIYGIKAGA